MELAKPTFDKLVAYLRSHGYPEESFGFEYQIGPYRADLVILDPATGVPISLFEVKGAASAPARTQAHEQLAAFARHLPDPSIPTYVVFTSDTEVGFEIEHISAAKKKELPSTTNWVSPSQLEYVAIRRARLAARSTSTSKEQDDTIENFKWVCWAIAFVALLLAIATILDILALDITDLFLLAAVVALIVLPFANKLKILGIEFERLQRERKGR